MDLALHDSLNRALRIRTSDVIQKAAMVAFVDYLSETFNHGDHTMLDTDFITKMAYHIKHAVDSPVSQTHARAFIEACLADTDNYDVLPMEDLMERLR